LPRLTISIDAFAFGGKFLAPNGPLWQSSARFFSPLFGARKAETSLLP
jgi:hypothetical protein